MEIITIVKQKKNWIVQREQAANSTLFWQSDILKVYVKGAMPMKECGRVINIAMNYQIAIGGRAAELKGFKGW